MKYKSFLSIVLLIIFLGCSGNDNLINSKKSIQLKEPATGLPVSNEILPSEIFDAKGSKTGNCGDGIITFTTEQCDDGNTTNEDGCNSSCQIEPDWYCTEEPSICGAPNPELEFMCGVNIALLMDNSGSIDRSELAQMKSALKGFVDALLPPGPDTPPNEIMVIKYNKLGHILIDYSSDPDDVKTAIDSVGVTYPGSVDYGYTNWDHAFRLAHNNPPDNDNPTLFIVASDGQPQGYGDEPSSMDFYPSLLATVDSANLIKADGIRILTVGIGVLFTDTMKAISSEDAFYSSDFGQLSVDLAELSNRCCNGILTVKKYVDGLPEGNWEFALDNLVGGTVVNTSSTTGDDGYVAFIINDIEEGVPASVNLSEIMQAGYSMHNAVCFDEEGLNVGASNGIDSIYGVSVEKHKITRCEFRNISPTYNGGLLRIRKNVDGLPEGNWEFALDNLVGGTVVNTSSTTGDDGYVAFIINDIEEGVPASVNLSEIMQAGYSMHNAVCFDEEGLNVGASNGVDGLTDVLVERHKATECEFNNTYLGRLEYISLHSYLDGELDANWEYSLYLPGNPNPWSTVYTKDSSYSYGRASIHLGDIPASIDTVHLTETVKPGYDLENAYCVKGGGIIVGSFDGDDSVRDIGLNTYGYSLACVFYNVTISTCQDEDGDGYYQYNEDYCEEGNDCDDSDPDTYPGAPELCDCKNNDCDCEIDEVCAGGIQERIDAASDGDVITVGPGEYCENIDYKGKAITLKSTDGPDTTIIKGRGYHVYYWPWEPPRPMMSYGNTVLMKRTDGVHAQMQGQVLDGFTVTRNPDAQSQVVEDGCYTGCMSQGGGVFVALSDAKIKNCKVIGNEAQVAGGIYFSNYYGNVEIVNSVVARNKAYEFGLGVMSFNSVLSIKNSTIVDNKFSEDMWCAVNPAPPTDNFAEVYTSGDYYDDEIHITNSIIRKGFDYVKPVVWTGDHDSGTVNYSNIEGPVPELTFGDGNIDLEPQFVAPSAGDFSLQITSPGIDAANGDEATTFDILGNERVDIDFDPSTVPNTGIGTPNYVDMGAYEKQLPEAQWDPRYDLYCDGVIDLSDLVLFGQAYYSTISNPLPGSVEYCADFTGDGHIDLSDVTSFAVHNYTSGPIDCCVTESYESLDFSKPIDPMFEKFLK